jgi:class 3 adenylate cyclase
MPPLGSRERAKLPDSAFAYVDSHGKRRLPIHDESHVRNALSRFSQVVFESDAARDRARTRLLRAAKKHGIVPIGFVSAELHPERKLPRGTVTLLMSDVEGSTELLRGLGDRYAHVLSEVRRVLRAAIRRAGGREVDARADEFFAAFEQAPAAVEAAVAVQRRLGERSWPDGVEVRLRIGIHRGRPTLTESGYVGLSVNKVARVCAAAQGGQVVLSSSARNAVADALGEGLDLVPLGSVKLRGFTEPEPLFQVGGEGLEARFAPPGGDAPRRRPGA